MCAGVLGRQRTRQRRDLSPRFVSSPMIELYRAEPSAAFGLNLRAVCAGEHLPRRVTEERRRAVGGSRELRLFGITKAGYRYIIHAESSTHIISLAPVTRSRPSCPRFVPSANARVPLLIPPALQRLSSYHAPCSPSVTAGILVHQPPRGRLRRLDSGRQRLCTLQTLSTIGAALSVQPTHSPLS